MLLKDTFNCLVLSFIIQNVEKLMTQKCRKRVTPAPLLLEHESKWSGPSRSNKNTNRRQAMTRHVTEQPRTRHVSELPRMRRKNEHVSYRLYRICRMKKRNPFDKQWNKFKQVTVLKNDARREWRGVVNTRQPKRCATRRIIEMERNSSSTSPTYIFFPLLAVLLLLFFGSFFIQ